MRIFSYKYNSFLFLFLIFILLFTSCIRKHKFDDAKLELSDNKMLEVLTDIFLMESYVSEKLPVMLLDSQTIIKTSLYDSIFIHHNVDSAAFFSTLNYYQAHPKKFIVLLKTLDSTINKITPLDTSSVPIKAIEVPSNIDETSGFNEQEKMMREQFVKTFKDSARFKNRPNKNK